MILLTLTPAQAKAQRVTAENASEYYAELAEAFFVKNDYYPREELKKHDPQGFRLMQTTCESTNSPA